MKLEADDLTQIKEIVTGVVSESQERLAQMIAKEVLGIREELARLRQEEPLTSELAAIKIDHETLRRRVHSIETGISEDWEAMKGVERRIQRLEAHVG